MLRLRLVLISFLLLSQLSYAAEICVWPVHPGSYLENSGNFYLVQSAPSVFSSFPFSGSAEGLYSELSSIQILPDSVIFSCFLPFLSQVGSLTGDRLLYSASIVPVPPGQYPVVLPLPYMDFANSLPDPGPPPPSGDTSLAAVMDKLNSIEMRIAQMDPTIITQTVSFLVGAFVGIAFVIASSLRY